MGICKGTFYKYYCDKYDLLQKCFVKHYYAVAEGQKSLTGFLSLVLPAFARTPKVILHAMSESDPDSLFSFHTNLLKTRILAAAEEEGLSMEDARVAYAVSFYAESVTRMTMAWLASGPASPEKFVEHIRDMCPALLTGVAAHL